MKVEDDEFESAVEGPLIWQFGAPVHAGCGDRHNATLRMIQRFVSSRLKAAWKTRSPSILTFCGASWFSSFPYSPAHSLIGDRFGLAAMWNF